MVNDDSRSVKECVTHLADFARHVLTEMTVIHGMIIFVAPLIGDPESYSHQDGGEGLGFVLNAE